MKRVVCFIDGFNFYHALDDIAHTFHHLKWVNLWSLASAFTTPSREKLEKVFYFSAFATWIPDAHLRHREFVKALEATGVTPILGHFKKKERRCGATCKGKWSTYEAKESDVNIAIHLLHHAHIGSFDKAQIITADSDLCPAIRLVKENFPNKQIDILVPPNRY